MFQSTRWILVLAAQTGHAERKRGFTGQVLGIYWKPVLFYLLKRGHSPESAEDLTQGFFAMVLERDLLDKADRSRGRFRSFLLTALDRYVSNERRAQHAKKRHPEGGMVALDGIEGWQAPAQDDLDSPERAFAYAWACSLLDKALHATEAHCRQSGLSQHWEVFLRTVWEPLRSGQDAPSLSDVCDALGIGSPKKASNMCITTRRAFAAILRGMVEPHVGESGDADAEIRDLMDILSWGRAASAGES